MLRLRCFGRLAIEDDGGERIELRSRKHLALLLYLAAHRDRRHERERVARLFWDTEVSLARHSLSQALYDLGKHLPGLDLDRTNREVGLGPEGLLYEGRALEEAVAADDLGRAVRLYDGSFAPDIETVGGPDFERWVERERTRYRSLAEKALLRRVSECADAGRWGEMCVAGNRLVDLNPLSEEAHRAVMRGLWLQGDRAAALAHFEEHEDFLCRELPGGVGEETRALVDRIRRSDRTVGADAVRERTRPEMVGREEEFRALRDALDDVVAGESRFVLVRGEAGMGKTRLLEEFAEVVALEDVRLLESRCYAAESDVPYGPVVDGLRELVREVDESRGDEGPTYHQLGHLFPKAFGEPERDEWDEMGKQTARRRLAEEIRQFLKGRLDGTPVAWFIEDLHWADATSLWVLSYLARRLEETPLLLVATSRRQASELAPEGVADDPWRRVRLGRLSSEEIQHLISAAGGDGPEGLSRIAHLADGNPFYALELAKSNLTEVVEGELEHSQRFREELPTAIARVLRSEIADVSDQEARILECMAVAEGHAYPNLVIDATELSTAELVRAAGRLRERGLLRSTDDRLAYGHDIVRRFVYHSLDALSRTALHRGIADWLAENRDDVDPGTLALHYHEADDSEKAYELSIDAARSAIERHANQEAINLSRLALDCAADDEAEGEASCLLGEAHYRSGNLRMVLKTLERLDTNDDYRTVVGDRSVNLLRADAAVELSEWKTVRIAVKALDQQESQRKRDYLWGKHLLMKAAIRSVDRELARQVLSDVDAIDVSATEVDCKALMWMTNTAYNAFYCDVSKCEAYIAFVQESADRLPHHLQYTVRNLCTVVALRLGKTDIAIHQATVTFTLASQHQDTVYALTSLNNVLAINLDRGDWEQAKSTVSKIDNYTKLGSNELGSNVALLLALNKGKLLLFTEQFEKAQEHLARTLEDAPANRAKYLKTELQACYGLTAAALGQTDKAIRSWDRIEKTYSEELSLITGVQDRYGLYWLKGFVAWKQNSGDPARELRMRADIEDEVDKLGAVRMRWIARMLDDTVSIGDGVSPKERSTPARTDEFRDLRDYGISWFGYYARRWFDRACSRVGDGVSTPR